MTARAYKSRRFAYLAPFGACFLATWGLIGLEPRLRVGELAAAFGLQVVVGGLLVLPGRLHQRPWVPAIGIVAFLGSVALLRDGVGTAPGYGSLLLLPVIWAALRSRRGELAFAITGAAVVLFAPIVAVGGTYYASSGWRSGALLIVIAAVLGITALALVERLRSSEERHRMLAETVERQRDDATELLASQNALREIATLVATGARSADVFDTVAEQLGRLFDGTLAAVVRFDGPSGVGEIVGSWSRDGTEIRGQTIDLAGETAAALVYRMGASAQVAAYETGPVEPIREPFALGAAVSAPIVVGGSLWGSVGAAFVDGTVIPPRCEERIALFAELVAVAIANAHAWETVTHQATTDPVTGLANHRAFHERLRSEVERASRHGRALSLALFDLDHFKQINDTHGHQTGDLVLAAVAQRLGAVARTGELVARIGGEEFAWLMPETTQDGAYLAAERARHVIEATPFQIAGALTISAGVCSNQQAGTAHELLGAADRALYHAKRSGRNVTFIYGPDTPRPVAVA